MYFFIFEIFFFLFLNFFFEFLKFWLFIFFEFFLFFFILIFFVRCHPSVLSHHALGTVECDESYCNEKGDHIWSSGCGEFFYHESYCDERVVMTIYEFQIFCDVSSGGGGGGWCMGGSTHIWGRRNAAGFLGD